MKSKNSGYTINISKYQDKSSQFNNISDKNENTTSNSNENMLENNIKLQSKSAFHSSPKNDYQMELLKSKNLAIKNKVNNFEEKNKKNKSTKSVLRIDDIDNKKRSLVLQNKLGNKSFLRDKNNKNNSPPNKSLLSINSKNNKIKSKSFHLKHKLNQTKNNFLKLINPNNNNKAIKDSKCSLIYGKNFIEVLEGDSLNIIEKKLQNKIYDMGKRAEFLEFEIGPLEVSINRLNIRKKKHKLTVNNHKKIGFDKKDINLSFKKNVTKTVIQKNIFRQLQNSNLNYSIEDDLLLEKNVNDSNINNKMNVSNNKFRSSLNRNSQINKSKNIIKKHKFSSDNNSINNYIKIGVASNNASDKRPSVNHFIKSNHSFKFSNTNRSKTVIDSKINSLSNENSSPKPKSNISHSKIKRRSKGCIYIDKENYRNLSHKKLIYDSLDDEEIIEDSIADNFYLNQNDKIVLIIDFLILIFTFWNMLYKPLNLALNNCDITNPITSFKFENVLNIFIDLLFILDLIINFFKSYYNFDEQLVTKSEKIILNYIKGYFFVDFISSIPYYSILKLISYKKHKNLLLSVKCTKYYNHEIHDRYQILDLFKLVKLLKCISSNNIISNTILNNLNQIKFFENWSFLLSSILMSLLILHLTACLHIFISSTAYPNWIISKQLDTSPFIKIYLSSIYFLITTVTSVGYGDIIGSSFTEIIFQIFLLIVGIIAYSWLISSISNYVKENNKQSEIFNQKLGILNDIKLEYPKLPQDLYDKIYLYLEYINLRQKKDKSSLIKCLPHSIKKPLLYEMYKPIIENFNFFKNFKNSEFANSVISKLKPVLSVKNDLLLEQGEIIEDAIFVKQGRLSLEVKIDIDHPEKSVEKLLNEEYFFGVENNELYQKSAFGGIINMTSFNHNQNIINKKNLYNLYSGSTLNENDNPKRIKSIVTNPQGETEIQKHPTTNINYIHLRIVDIRKNEHFGTLLMFLNKRSPLTLRVKTKKAELFYLKKIDAVEISTSYPNIWKRVNKKSFHNLKQIKKIMKNIIKHYCETYGINLDFETKINDDNLEKSNLSNLNKVITNKDKSSSKIVGNNLNALNKKLMVPRRGSVDVYKQFSMLHHFPKQQNLIATKTNKEKNIEELVPKNFQINNNNTKDNINDKDHDKDNSINDYSQSKINKNQDNEQENPMDCSISIIKKKKKDSILGYGHPIYIRNSHNNLEISLNKNLNNNSILVNHENYSQNNQNKSNLISKIMESHYGVEETDNLMKFFGTPYYPKDINDEVYPGEIFDITNRKNNSEMEYSRLNNFILSYSTPKNDNLSNFKSKFFIPFRSNYEYIGINNLKINNNFITKSVINRIESPKKRNELSIFSFCFHLNHDKNNRSFQIKKANIKNINLSIFKNSFQLSSYKKPDNYININNDKRNIVNNDITNVNSNINSDVNNINNIYFQNINNNIKRNSTTNKRINKVNIKNIKNNDSESYSSSKSFSYSSFSSSQSYSNDENENFFTSGLQPKNTNENEINNTNTFKSARKENNNNKHNMIKKREIIFNIYSSYENLNVISKGKFSKSKKLQNCIKNILIKKILKHKKETLSPKKRISLSAKKLIKQKTSNNFQNIFTNNINKLNLNNDKLKKTEVKSLFKKNLISTDILENNKVINSNKSNKHKENSRHSSNSILKRRKTKKNNDEFLLDYVSRNIRDDNAVLNNPGQFYNGLFSTIIKNANLSKK